MRDHPVIGEQILRQIPGMEQIARGGPPRARALGRGRLPGRACRRADPAREPDRVRLRRLSRDDLRPALPLRRWTSAAAIAELRENAGSQFDPDVVEALLEVLGDEAMVLGCAPSEGEERHRREALERIACRVRRRGRLRLPQGRTRHLLPPGGQRAAARAGPATSSCRPASPARLPALRAAGRIERSRRATSRYGSSGPTTRAARSSSPAAVTRSSSSAHRPTHSSVRASARWGACRARCAAGRSRVAGEAARRRARGARRGPRRDHRQRERRRGGAGRDLRACRHRAFVRVRAPWSSIARHPATRFGWSRCRLGSRHRIRPARESCSTSSPRPLRAAVERPC